MSRFRMHDDEVLTDVALVRRMLAEQFPQWMELPIEPVDSYGTDHDIYRVGSDLSVRLPRVAWAIRQAAKEAALLPLLAPHLPLKIPVQLAAGRPVDGYPFEWSVYEWLPGTSAEYALDDLEQGAVDLAGFISALRRIDTADAPPRPPGSRGGPLIEMDKEIRGAIAEAGDRVDGPALLRSWQESLDAPHWDGPEVWVHGDLLPGNLLVHNGRLSAAIDFGALGVGDPACDLVPAWTLFSGASRQRFREELAVDEASWLRGRGWAMRLIVCVPYYWETNPGMIRLALRTLHEVLGG
jgi:aminoglycoside phosphotransferase (APT) family kinase protein